MDARVDVGRRRGTLAHLGADGAQLHVFILQLVFNLVSFLNILSNAVRQQTLLCWQLRALPLPGMQEYGSRTGRPGFGLLQQLIYIRRDQSRK